ncbi:MAG: sigma-70 family RNA polymerase sigma factor [Candidatus Pacebacteria bacterium]|nr:sigma-70 family RNA polymerase sigma factor [Candidatus Paceibacterota bacterium]
MGKKFDFPLETLRAYLEDKANIGLRDELIERAIPVVRRTAMLIVKRQRIWLPQHIDEDELVSEGLVQITPIVEVFNPPECKNLSGAFRIHVSRRMHWRLVDYIRDERLNSRTTMDHALRFKAAFKSFQEEAGYAPLLEDVASKLSISSEVAEEWRVLAMELDVRNVSIDQEFSVTNMRYKSFSLHDMLVDVPHQTLEERDVGFLALLPSSLRPIERAIIISVYRDNKTMFEIGSAFGISESRISQMFSDILPRIRTAYFERLRRENGECDG